MSEPVNNTNALDGWGIAQPEPRVTLPSGVSVRVSPLDIPKMVELDILDKMDAFTPKVLDEGKKKGKKAEEPSVSPEKLVSLMEVLDKVAVACVLDPKLSPKPADGVLKEGVRYVHKIGLADKMAIFQAAFSGMEEFFRLSGQQAADLGAVAPIEAPSATTK